MVKLTDPARHGDSEVAQGAHAFWLDVAYFLERKAELPRHPGAKLPKKPAGPSIAPGDWPDDPLPDFLMGG